MEYKQIQELIKMINKSNISEFCVEEGEFKLTIKQDHSGQQPQFVAMPQAAPMQMQMPMAMPQAQVPQAAAAPAQPSAGAPANNDKLITIKSPMIGTFYRSPSPDKPLFVNVGDEIDNGQVLCIIEAMKLFNEIESEMKGRIVKVLADDASPVEYDQPLFLVEIL